jgi:hypothetical protein
MGGQFVIGQNRDQATVAVVATVATTGRRC